MCAIVARRHEPYWRRALGSLPARNLITQPRNCGTANGLLLAVLHILERDPLARILFLPADHYVLDEVSLVNALRNAVTLPTHTDGSLLLIGIKPDLEDPDLGYGSALPCVG